jgi:hypothetical protein
VQNLNIQNLQNNPNLINQHNNDYVYPGEDFDVNYYRNNNFKKEQALPKDPDVWDPAPPLKKKVSKPTKGKFNPGNPAQINQQVMKGVGKPSAPPPPPPASQKNDKYFKISLECLSFFSNFFLL